jgi:hypothetical protein
MDNNQGPLEDLVGEFFVDRDYEFKLFWEWATNIPNRVGNSFALVGRRRTGKTAILARLFNRLFYEQKVVMPVFITFAHYMQLRRPLTMEEVGDHYLSSYIRCFLAFRYGRPEIMGRVLNMNTIKQVTAQFNDPIVNELIEEYELSLQSHLSGAVAQMAINTPRSVAWLNRIKTAVIVDEFQVLTNVYDPKQGVSHDLTDGFQPSVDTRWAPMLVSGSAVSLLVNKALGGMLSGRFHYWYMKPLAREYAHELVFRLGSAFNLQVTLELAETIWQLTIGYPYAIYGIITSLSPARDKFPALDALEEVMIFELTNPLGKLWQHYREEFEKYSEQLNQGNVTRRVMLWAIKHPDERIDAERVATEIGLDEQEIQAALEKLRWIDVVEKIGLISYKGPNDPMMRRFIEYQHYTEIDKLAPAQAMTDWEKEYKRLRGHMNHFIGEAAEMYVHVIMRCFDGRDVEGNTYFNNKGLVNLPVFKDIKQRGGIVKAGVPIEIDLTGEWPLPEEGTGAWLVQVKYTQAAMGPDEVRHFLAQTDALIKEAAYTTAIRWYICKGGFTTKALKLLQEVGILYSDRTEFNALANLFGFYGLPK